MTDLRDPTDETATESPLLFARVLDGKGGGRPLTWDQVQGWKPAAAGELLWIHLKRNEPGVQAWLEREFAIPEPTAELLTSDGNRPRAFHERDTLVAVLRGINFNPGAEPEDMVSMQLWSDGTRLATLRAAPLQTPREVLARIDAGDGPTDPGATITLIAELLISRMNQSIVDMNEVIDELEDEDPESDPENMLRRISVIRRNCLALKRHMSPQHEALEYIGRDAPDWFEDHDRREIAESIARLRRYIDDIDISKESALVLQDELRARSQASSENATYKLTVVAGIFLPLGFLTGLLGINVGGMPGVNDPQAFWEVVALCVASLIGLLLLFKRLRWL